jgi:hypothetical protein
MKRLILKKTATLSGDLVSRHNVFFPIMLGKLQYMLQWGFRYYGDLCLQ